MKSPISIFFCTALLTGWASSQVPQKAPLSRYSGLWNNSPFTAKPPPPEAGPTVNPLENFVLLGVSPIRGGYRVTMMEKKAPDKRITVDSDNENSSYKILGVSRQPGDALGTSVQMSIGGQTGIVRYDAASLVLAAAPPPIPTAPPGQPPIPNAQPMATDQQPVRQPRPRVVPPPAPTANGQPAPQQQMPQGQPSPPQNQRPQRRAN